MAIERMLKQWKKDGTKMLGTLAVIVPGVLVIPDLIPAAQAKYWLLANLIIGALTIKRGYSNSAAIKSAQSAGE